MEPEDKHGKKGTATASVGRGLHSQRKILQTAQLRPLEEGLWTCCPQGQRLASRSAQARGSTGAAAVTRNLAPEGRASLRNTSHLPETEEACSLNRIHSQPL